MKVKELRKKSSVRVDISLQRVLPEVNVRTVSQILLKVMDSVRFLSLSMW